MAQPTLEDLGEHVRQSLLRADRPDRMPKDEARALLVARKRENLRERYDVLRRVEGRAITLIGRPDFSDIEPALVPVAPKDTGVWEYLRNVLSSAPYGNQPGRSMLYFIADRRSGGILGVVELASDLDALGPRDRYIAWTKTAKYRQRKMNSVLNLATCITTAPFGLLTGGKCAAAMVVSSDVARLWQHKYASPLAGASTTSLYGKSSQYNRLSMWHYLGVTLGVGTASLTDNDYRAVKAYVSRSGVSGRMVGHGGTYNSKMATITMAANLVGVPRPSSNMPKGCYFAEYGEHARSFLRGERERFTPDVPSMAERSAWWMDRWYAMRWPKVRDDIDAWSPLSYSLAEQMRADEA